MEAFDGVRPFFEGPWGTAIAYFLGIIPLVYFFGFGFANDDVIGSRWSRIREIKFHSWALAVINVFSAGYLFLYASMVWTGGKGKWAEVFGAFVFAFARVRRLLELVCGFYSLHSLKTWMGLPHKVLEDMGYRTTMTDNMRLNETIVENKIVSNDPSVPCVKLSPLRLPYPIIHPRKPNCTAVRWVVLFLSQQCSEFHDVLKKDDKEWRGTFRYKSQQFYKLQKTESPSTAPAQVEDLSTQCRRNKGSKTDGVHLSEEIPAMTPSCQQSGLTPDKSSGNQKGLKRPRHWILNHSHVPFYPLDSEGATVGPNRQLHTRSIRYSMEVWATALLTTTEEPESSKTSVSNSEKKGTRRLELQSMMDPSCWVDVYLSVASEREFSKTGNNSWDQNELCCSKICISVSPQNPARKKTPKEKRIDSHQRALRYTSKFNALEFVRASLRTGCGVPYVDPEFDRENQNTKLSDENTGSANNPGETEDEEEHATVQSDINHDEGLAQMFKGPRGVAALIAHEADDESERNQHLKLEIETFLMAALTDLDAEVQFRLKDSLSSHHVEQFIVFLFAAEAGKKASERFQIKGDSDPGRWKIPEPLWTASDSSDKASRRFKFLEHSQAETHVETLQKQLGLGLDGLHRLESAKCAFPLPEKTYGPESLWENKLVLQVSAHIDNWIALSLGLGLRRHEGCTCRLEPKKKGSRSIRESSRNYQVSLMRNRFERMDPDEYQELNMTFLGCVVEELRSSMAHWVDQNKRGSRQPNFSPALSALAKEKEEFFASAQLTRLLLGYFERDPAELLVKSMPLTRANKSALGTTDIPACAAGKLPDQPLPMPIAMRLLWECQYALQKAMADSVETKDSTVPFERGYAAMLMMLGFPGLLMTAKTWDKMSSHVVSGVSRWECRIKMLPVGQRERVHMKGIGVEAKIVVKKKFKAYEQAKITLGMIGGGEGQVWAWDEWRDEFLGRLDGTQDWQQSHDLSHELSQSFEPHLQERDMKADSLRTVITCENDGMKLGIRKISRPRSEEHLPEKTTEQDDAEWIAWPSWHAFRCGIAKFELQKHMSKDIQKCRRMKISDHVKRNPRVGRGMLPPAESHEYKEASIHELRIKALSLYCALKGKRDVPEDTSSIELGMKQGVRKTVGLLVEERQFLRLKFPEMSEHGKHAVDALHKIEVLIQSVDSEWEGDITHKMKDLKRLVEMLCRFHQYRLAVDHVRASFWKLPTTRECGVIPMPTVDWKDYKSPFENGAERQKPEDDIRKLYINIFEASSDALAIELIAETIFYTQNSDEKKSFKHAREVLEATCIAYRGEAGEESLLYVLLDYALDHNDPNAMGSARGLYCRAIQQSRKEHYGETKLAMKGRILNAMGLVSQHGLCQQPRDLERAREQFEEVSTELRNIQRQRGSLPPEASGQWYKDIKFNLGMLYKTMAERKSMASADKTKREEYMRNAVTCFLELEEDVDAILQLAKIRMARAKASVNGGSDTTKSDLNEAVCVHGKLHSMLLEGKGYPYSWTYLGDMTWKIADLMHRLGNDEWMAGKKWVRCYKWGAKSGDPTAKVKLARLALEARDPAGAHGVDRQQAVRYLQDVCDGWTDYRRAMKNQMGVVGYGHLMFHRRKGLPRRDRLVRTIDVPYNENDTYKAACRLLKRVKQGQSVPLSRRVSDTEAPGLEVSRWQARELDMMRKR